MLIIVIVFSPQIVIIEHKSIICSGYNAVLHIHTCIEEVQIVVRHIGQKDKVLFKNWDKEYCWLQHMDCDDCFPSVTYFGLWLHLQALICLIDKKTGEKGQKRPRFVKQDQVCIARLRTAGTICLETFKEFPQMGRFTLRDEGKN